MGHLNGDMEKEIHQIRDDVSSIKDELSTAINGLTIAVNALTSKFDAFMRVAESSIPVKAVFWLMAIMVLGLIGVEGVKQIGPAVTKFLSSF